MSEKKTLTFSIMDGPYEQSRTVTFNYAVKGQDASGLSFGDVEQTNPPQIERDIRQLTEKGVAVYVVEDDASERGIGESDFVNGVKPLPRNKMAELFSGYDQTWHW